MPATQLCETTQVKELVAKAAGLSSSQGNERLKRLVARIVTDICATIEDFDISDSEFWSAVEYIVQLSKQNEAGLLIPGLGIEHFLDLRLDAKEKQCGIEGGTPRTIEGPLYIPNAPLSISHARLDRDPDEGEVLVMKGNVATLAGAPIAGATVEVWHANSKGNYSFFDASQTPFNLRGRIVTEDDGAYSLRTRMPVGYACPPEGPTQALLTKLGRHGRRPAHIHFLVSAPRYRSLTTQINIDGDAYLHDDFAFATREGLIPPISREEAPAAIHTYGLDAPFLQIDFNFVLHEESVGAPASAVERARVQG